MAKDPKTEDNSARSPFAGCTIILVGIGAMLFLVCFVIWNLFKLDGEISKFTTDKAVETPVPDLVADAAAFNQHKAKIQLFQDAVGKSEDAELRLSSQDINFAIAGDSTRFKDLQKTFSVTKIEEGKLHIQISFPLRGKPMSGEMRYLNGTMVAVPSLTGGEIVLNVESIHSPGTEVTDVPEGFIGQLSPYRVTQRYVEDETLGPWMKKLTSVAVDGDTVVLGYTHQEATAAALPKDMSPFIKRAVALFAVFAVFFLAVIIGMVTISKRRRAASGGSND